MRTWYVPLTILDDNRVLAQHREIHSLVGSILSSKRGYQNHPVTKLYKGEHMLCLLDYHNDTTDEMNRRGWRGHNTPISEEALFEGAQRATENTCFKWQKHTDKVIPVEGDYSLQADMHDLVTRWTNEHKWLRSDLAAEFVLAHQQYCKDACCVTYATDLVSEFDDRRQHSVDHPIKGHKSLGDERFELLLPANLTLVGV